VDRTLDMYLRDVRFGSRRERSAYLNLAIALHWREVAEVDEFIALVGARLAELDEFLAQTGRRRPLTAKSRTT